MKKSIPAVSARTSFLLIGLFFSLSLFGQTTKPDFENTIVSEFCDSFTKASPRINKENLNMEVGVIILSLMTRHSEAMKSAWGLDIGNKDDLWALLAKKLGSWPP